MWSSSELFHGQFLIGIAACLGCIAVHAMIMALLISVVHRTSLATQNTSPHRRLILIMWATVSVLLLAHLIEITIWGFAYAKLGVVANESDAVYFAFVNYTTLGYGDVLPVKQWRLLGPIAAMNGVLLFGWSTAVIYDVLRTVLPRPNPAG